MKCHVCMFETEASPCSGCIRQAAILKLTVAELAKMARVFSHHGGRAPEGHSQEYVDPFWARAVEVGLTSLMPLLKEPSLKEQALTLKGTGMSVSRIANALAVKPNTVRSWVTRGVVA